jgi:hypothetical protein
VGCVEFLRRDANAATPSILLTEPLQDVQFVTTESRIQGFDDCNEDEG